MLGKKFPVNERVAAGVSYLDMLKQVGFLGALIVMFMVMSEVGRVVGMAMQSQWAVIGGLSIAFGLYTKSLGQPLLILLMLIMVPLATTELGTDTLDHRPDEARSPQGNELGLGLGLYVFDHDDPSILRRTDRPQTLAARSLADSASSPPAACISCRCRRA